MLGIAATAGAAFPTGGNPVGDTDAGWPEFKEISGSEAQLGFHAGGPNQFEGFFEVDIGGRVAYTIEPKGGPFSESVDATIAGDKLKFEVIRRTLKDNGLSQYWYYADGTKASETPVDFPRP